MLKKLSHYLTLSVSVITLNSQLLWSMEKGAEREEMEKRDAKKSKTEMASSVEVAPSIPVDGIILNIPGEDYANHPWQGHNLLMTSSYAQQIQEELNTGQQATIFSTGDIIFADNIKIEWSNDAILKIEAVGSVIFGVNSLLKNTGSGGLKIATSDSDFFGYISSKEYPKNEETRKQELKTASISFKDSTPSIDFTANTGSISFFYNPQQQGDQHRYIKQQDFTTHVLVGPKCYFNAFMLIHDEKDLEDMKHNPQGNYVLNQNICLSWKDNYTQMHDCFKGIFNYNAKTLKSHNWNDIGEDYFFEHALTDDQRWGKHILYLSPPLNDKQLQLKQALIEGNQTILKEEEWTTSYIGDGTYHQMAYVFDQQLTTPLHLAVEYGRMEFVKAILNRIFLGINNEKDAALKLRHCFSVINRPNLDGDTALHLAVKHSHADIVALLIEMYDQYKQPFDCEAITLLAQQTMANAQQAPQSIITLLSQHEELPRELSTHYVGFPKPHEAREREQQWQQQVHEKFFKRKPSTYRAITILEDFGSRYQKKQPQIQPYSLDGLPSRSRILLFKAITDTKLKTWFDKPSKDYWDVKDVPNSSGSGSHKEWKDRFFIKYTYGGQTHTLENRPTYAKIGYVYYVEMGNYDNIAQEATTLEQSLAWSKIAELSQSSRLTGQAVSAEQLFQAGYQGRTPIDAACFLNCLNILLDLEVASRLSRNQKGEFASDFDALPISTFCAKSFLLQRQEKQIPKEFLAKKGEDNTGHHHAFTDKVEDRQHAIDKVNELARNKQPVQFSTLESAKIQEWQNTHPYGIVIETPEGLHQLLLSEYGGGYESEGEPYQ